MPVARLRERRLRPEQHLQGDLIRTRLLCALLAVAACGDPGAPTFDCTPECPAHFHCTAAGCVPDDTAVHDMAAPRSVDLAGQCVPDCRRPTPFCRGGTCVECITDPDCPIGSYCRGGDGGVLGCAPGCVNGDHCGPGQGCCGGACVDLSNDPHQCGGCGKECFAIHGVAGCRDGGCTLAGCQAPWGNCNQDDADGCEVNLHTDWKNCGGCGVVCAPKNAVPLCSASGCHLAACAYGWDDCNSDESDGCETQVDSDPKSCGACGHACPAAAHAQVACTVGLCALSSCSAGYGDCNGVFGDGCEAALGSDKNNCGQCGVTCGANQICVKGACTCQQCNIPNAVTACVNNQCVLQSCLAGYGDCDRNPMNGCEVDLRTDVRNCGACGSICGPQKPYCLGGACDSAGVSCAAILQSNPKAASGPYTLDPDGAGGNPPFIAWCDMSGDGGGWTLVAKVHRYHTGFMAYDEPDTWFAQERDTAALADITSYDNRLPGQSSWGQVRLAPLAARSTVARFVLIAEADPNQRAQWFKALAPDLFLWFGQADHAATTVCLDAAMSQRCTQGKLRGSPASATFFDGMNLADQGYPGGGPIHMRQNNDQQGAMYHAICSYTFNNNGNQWNDTAIDGHWGNGLEIWMR